MEFNPGEARKMKYLGLFILLICTTNCLSLIARIGVWIDSTSGYTDAPRSSYWKYAYVSTSHKSSYAGGHGLGGTNFDDINVNLVLQPKKGNGKEILLEHASIPGDSKDGLIYTLVSRNYDLKFSEDGKKLAITYDHEYYGYVGLDLNNDSLVFSRFLKFKPEKENFWKVFPEPKQQAIDLLKNNLIQKHSNFQPVKDKGEPYFKSIVYGAYQDDLEKPFSYYLQTHADDEEILIAALTGVLEMGDRYSIPEEFPSLFEEGALKFQKVGTITRSYLESDKMGHDGTAYAVHALRKAADRKDLDLIARNLDKIYSMYKSSSKGESDFVGWQLKRMLWATASICKRLETSNKQLEDFLVKIIKEENNDLYDPIHFMQVYSIQALSYMKSGTASNFLKLMSLKYPPKDPINSDLWPKEYNNHHKNCCEKDDKYSSCNPKDLSIWLKLAVTGK